MSDPESLVIPVAKWVAMVAIPMELKGVQIAFSVHKNSVRELDRSFLAELFEVLAGCT